MTEVPSRWITSPKEVHYTNRLRGGGRTYLKLNKSINPAFVQHVYDYYRESGCRNYHLRKKFKIDYRIAKKCMSNVI